jgi:hypothetical protein
MQKAILLVVSIVALAVGGFFAWQSGAFGNMSKDEGVFCTADAMQCPDGSYVGRTGPNCEFVCPAGVPTTGETETITLKIGERGEVLGIFVTPLSILEDSRCPIDVQCIQAGTVRVKMQVETGMGTGDLTLALGDLGTTETETITLTRVSPEPVSTDPIVPSEYRLTFELKKRK